MVERFGDHLVQFARSIDIVREDDFRNIIITAKKYALEAFNLKYFELYLYNIGGAFADSGFTKEEKLLSWRNIDSGRQQWDHHLKDAEGRPIGQISYAFINELPLWIVDEAQNPLHFNDEISYKDFWSNSPSEEIPIYQKHSSSDADILTCICFPLSVVEFNENSRSSIVERSGVLTFESEQYYEPTDEAKEEIAKIAEAIAITNHLRYSRFFQYSNTERARRRLEDRLSECLLTLRTYSFVQRPKLFFGFPQEGAKDVISMTRRILEELETVDVYDWDKDNSPRNIHQSIFEEIRKSRYGVFYLSKIANSSDTSQTQQSEYVDNLNVLIEIGMMYSLQADLGETNLIIIREQDSPNIPFDLAAQKRIDVERNAPGKLREENFRSALEDSLAHLLRN